MIDYLLSMQLWQNIFMVIVTVIFITRITRQGPFTAK